MTFHPGKFEKASPRLEEFFSNDLDGLVYISHASILVRLNGKTFLFDPVLAKPPHLGSWLFYPEMEADPRLLTVDAVFVSHQHQDHYDTDFLRLLPATTPIYIVEGRPQFEALLNGEGIAYSPIPAETFFDLGSGVNCVGINHEYNGIDAAVAISNGKFTVYHGNDCFVSNDKLSIIRKAYPKVDVACVPFAFVHWYPFLLDGVDEKWKASEADRLITEYLEYGLRQIERLEPEVAIPFGANMFYADDVDSEHNRAVMSPFDFKEYAERKNVPEKDVIRALFAGDTIYSKPVASGARELDVVQKPFSNADLRLGFSQFWERVQKEGTGFDAASLEALTHEDVKDRAFIEPRMTHAEDVLDHNIYISNMDHPDWGLVQIDLSDRSVKDVAAVDASRPYHHFRLTDLAYKAYFSQEFTFNEIIASSRFRLQRAPNEYNLPVLKVVNNVL